MLRMFIAPYWPGILSFFFFAFLCVWRYFIKKKKVKITPLVAILIKNKHFPNADTRNSVKKMSMRTLNELYFLFNTVKVREINLHQHPSDSLEHNYVNILIFLNWLNIATAPKVLNCNKYFHAYGILKALFTACRDSFSLFRPVCDAQSRKSHLLCEFGALLERQSTKLTVLIIHTVNRFILINASVVSKPHETLRKETYSDHLL